MFRRVLFKKILLTSFLMLSMQFQSATAEVLSHGLGFTITPEFDSVIDLHERKLISMGFTISQIDSYTPIGFVYQPYYQYDNGIGIGGGIGPFLFIGTSTATSITNDTLDIIFTNLPINIDVRYAYNPRNFSVEPFIKAGLRYNIANGDFVVSSKLGFYSAVGLEFNVDNDVSFIFEYAVDNSEIVFNDVFGRTTLKPNETMITFLVMF